MTGPIAGPSRLRCFARTIHYSSRLQASPPKRRKIPTPTLTSSNPTPALTRSPLIQQTPASHLTDHTGVRTPPLAASWRWHPLPNPSKPDVIEEERTLFARPFEVGRPRMYWFGFLVSGLFFTTWLTFPPSARSLPPIEGQTWVLFSYSRKSN
jgi:hypothetical protein